jgi:hypothetical protein
MNESPMDQLRLIDPITYIELQKAENLGQNELRTFLKELMSTASSQSNWAGRDGEAAMEQFEILKQIENDLH